MKILKKKVPAVNYEVKVKAAKQMKLASRKIIEYKKELGIGVSSEDLDNTGLIGFNTSVFTTSLGSLSAKRTASHTDMAAVAVEYLTRGGVRAGDYVALHMSGSLPGLNLAAISACEQMGLKTKIIASGGSSNYGANHGRLTFPDMLIRLIADGVFQDNLVAISLGGKGDVGGELSEKNRNQLIAGYNGYRVKFIYESDLRKNILLRDEIYQHYGKVSCFFNVGGNRSAIGENKKYGLWGYIPPEDSLPALNKDSGLVEWYHSKGIPVIHFVKVKKLVKSVGLPYNPKEMAEIGTSSIYFMEKISLAKVAIVAASLFAIIKRITKKKEEK